MITIKNRQVFSTEGKYIHRLNSETYFKMSTVLPTDTVDMFEEVDELPKYTEAEYNAKVSELVREKYTADAEFAIQRKFINTLIHPALVSDDKIEEITEKYNAYNDFVEQCKEEAKNPDLYSTAESEPFETNETDLL